MQLKFLTPSLIVELAVKLYIYQLHRAGSICSCLGVIVLALFYINKLSLNKHVGYVHRVVAFKTESIYRLPDASQDGAVF